jgi:oxygen-independent coproporphyrinogen-3 oxidase
MSFVLDNLSEAFLSRYNVSGPRYTSYPTAPMWSDTYGPKDFEQALTRIAAPLSLYTHLPFCESRCLFCGCNVVISRRSESAETYLGYLFREMAQVAELTPVKKVTQFHWGGGTPTYLTPDQIERLFNEQRRLFDIDPHTTEIGIEVDPRVTTDEQLVTLRRLGFNRISMGVQDFDPLVQETIRRIQPVDLTENMVNRCRDLGFEGINLDLIYGLPHQSLDGFQRSVETIIRLNPDRIALYNYAHVPWMSPHQKHIPEDKLPKGPEKFAIFKAAIHMLLDAGYLYIGMDHFAKPHDELARAQQLPYGAPGGLHRNFMGYTTRAGSELIGLGVSAISGLAVDYAQNWRRLPDYYAAIDRGELPTMRGVRLSAEDEKRRFIINSLLCQGVLMIETVNETFGGDFQRDFAEALTRLAPLAEDGLITLSPEAIRLTPLGRIFSRNGAMPFDAYLSQPEKPLFSKTL